MEEMNNTTQPTPAPSAQVPPQGVPTPPVMNKNMIALLSYLGILIIIPFLVAKDDSFVKFHIKQGLVLIVLSVILYFGSFLLPFFGTMIYYVASLLILILAILGILNVVKGETKELPVIGGFASKINF